MCRFSFYYSLVGVQNSDDSIARLFQTVRFFEFNHANSDWSGTLKELFTGSKTKSKNPEKNYIYSIYIYIWT